METKKLKKLSINKMHEFPVIEEQEQMALKGGDAPGAQAYYEIYGETLPPYTSYDVNTDTCSFYEEDPNQAQGTIGETDFERWNRMNDLNRSYGGHEYGPIYEMLVRWGMGE